MRKYLLALLVLSGVAAAQRLRVPILHRDPEDAQRARLHEKLTRLRETRNSLAVPEGQSARDLDALTAAAQPKRPAPPAKPKRVTHQAAASASAWPPLPQAWTHGEQQPSLGEVARQNRARKRQASSSSAQ